ncbi:MAG: phosphoribosylaminoimidazolesuccinocarboxamide synthase [Kiritimatiellae bacterium]|nr:phosphoribosylaminoimidazolesuccinocarboxamide synthase [Kiritimatiellia bacterium]
MIDEQTLKAQLPNVLEQTELEALGPVHRGKVRDSYPRGERRILVTTDRVSAFDCVLGTIPFKGQVLNQLAAFWFERTRGIAPNHMLDVPDPNVMVVAECEQLPVEFVVRGYITGVTKTSLWYNYEQGVRRFCGHALPEGLRKDQKLVRPILTPTTKLEKHDRPISREEAVREGLVDAATFDRAAEICFALYEFGAEHARRRGLIFVDTKYELGRKDGELVVTDEIHTPDSSRYWFADTYEELFAAGREQRKIDKEYVRQWLAERGFRGEGEPPALSDEVRIEAAKRYVQAYETVTGQNFQMSVGPVSPRIAQNLEKAGYMT